VGFRYSTTTTTCFTYLLNAECDVLAMRRSWAVLKRLTRQWSGVCRGIRWVTFLSRAPTTTPREHLLSLSNLLNEQLNNSYVVFVFVDAPRKMCWGSVKEDVKSFGLSREDAYLWYQEVSR